MLQSAIFLYICPLFARINSVRARIMGIENEIIH